VPKKNKAHTFEKIKSIGNQGQEVVHLQQ